MRVIRIIHGLIIICLNMRTPISLFGYGPKLALSCLPYIILSLIVMYKYPESKISRIPGKRSGQWIALGVYGG